MGDKIKSCNNFEGTFDGIFFISLAGPERFSKVTVVFPEGIKIKVRFFSETTFYDYLTGLILQVVGDSKMHTETGV